MLSFPNIHQIPFRHFSQIPSKLTLQKNSKNKDMSAPFSITALFCVFYFSFNYGVLGFTACNLYQECESQIVDDKQITCYGHQSCQSAQLTGISGMPRTMNCNGAESCSLSSMSSFQYAYCQGSKSCHSATTISSDHIECGGLSSCQSVTNLIETRNIYCQGSKSCSKSNIKCGVESVCNGNRACYKSEIQCAESIQCNGIHSCSGSKLISNLGDITCNGKGSCHSTTIETNNVNGYGHYSLSYADINAESIHGMGYYSLMYATIDSDSKEEIDIKSYGHMSGYGATIICQRDSKCILHCKSSGCVNMDFICLAGSQCKVISNELDDGLIWKQSSNEEQDKELLDYVEERKLDRKYDKINNQCLFELSMNDDDDIDNGNVGNNYDNVINMIFASMIYSNLFISFIVFVVTFVISWFYYSMKYRDNNIYKEIQ